MNSVPEDIRERAFRFALQVIKFSDKLPSTRSSEILAQQLIRSATSIGSNAQEALAAHSRKDFIYKNTLALKEARETHYWLRLMNGCRPEICSEIQSLQEESKEIMLIFGAIVSRSRGTSKKSRPEGNV